MFKRIASEALGLSDIGIIVPPSDYTKVDADDYLFHEDGERIFFLIKSKKDEYCFTNFALIHVDGESAVSAKRSIKRYEFSHARVSGVSIETAGTVDRDVELKFRIDELAFSIDVRKDFIEALKDVYKALIAIGHQRSAIRSHATTYSPAWRPWLRPSRSAAPMATTHWPASSSCCWRPPTRPCAPPATSAASSRSTSTPEAAPRDGAPPRCRVLGQ